MSNQTKVDALPKCDICTEISAYDAKTIYGAWGYLCEGCFKQVGVGLGLGLGQKLVLA